MPCRGEVCESTRGGLSGLPNDEKISLKGVCGGRSNYPPYPMGVPPSKIHMGLGRYKFFLQIGIPHVKQTPLSEGTYTFAPVFSRVEILALLFKGATEAAGTLACFQPTHIVTWCV